MSTNFAADPAVSAAAQQAQQLVARTKNLEIISAEGFTEAAQTLKVIKGAVQQVDDAEERIKRPMMNALAEVRLQADTARAPFLEVETRIKAAILIYNRAQEKLRLEAQQKADTAARKERERLQAVADAAAAKAAREAQERREAADRAAAEGKAAEADRLRLAAAKIEEKAVAKVDQFESRAAATVAPVIASAAPKVAGVGMRDNWTWRLKDKTKLNESFKIADEAKITKTVKSLKGEALDVIGAGAVEIFNQPVIASGRA